MSSTWIDFAELKKRVSLVSVLERYGHLRKLKDNGKGQLTGPCPIHGGLSPTAFNVSKDKNIFNCFSKCGGGNVIDYVMKVEDCNARAAGEKIVKLFNLSFSACFTSSRDDRI